MGTFPLKKMQTLFIYLFIYFNVICIFRGSLNRSPILKIGTDPAPWWRGTPDSQVALRRQRPTRHGASLLPPFLPQSNWSLPGFGTAADTATDRHELGGGGGKEEGERAAAGISSVSVPGSLPSNICNSNAVACASATGLRRTRLHLYLLRLGVSDSRWGCGPIRRRLLEDDEWGRLRGAREEWRHRQTGDAHSCLGEWV